MPGLSHRLPLAFHQHVTNAHADTYAASLSRSLGFAAPPGATALADRVWGRASLGLVARGPAVRLVGRGARSWCLYLRESLPRRTQHYLVAREVAAFCLRADGVDLSSAQVGVSLVLPVETFDDAIADGVEVAADELELPLAATALRRAELHRVPTAIVTPRWSRVRGDDAGRLPTDHATLRALAAPGLAVCGLRRTRTADGETLIQVA